MEKIKLLLESIVSDPDLKINSAQCKVTKALNMLNKLETKYQNSSQLDSIVMLATFNAMKDIIEAHACVIGTDKTIARFIKDIRTWEFNDEFEEIFKLRLKRTKQV